ncbi:PQQ-binding-like beta-propeller repeat protein [Actinosynnema sp. NPDC050436]|uniref:outer membrane protein assembly factor BamB family protein n=1 Tax=Actinosynnema sp. NPDC050436 TaxID=3155659 RepID=UPI00340363EA
MLRYLTLVGAASAAVAPFLPGGAARSDTVDWPVIGLAVGVIAVAALGFARHRAARTAAVLAGVAAFGLVLRLLLPDLGAGLTGPRLPVLAVGAAAVALGVGASGGWRVRPVGVVAAVVAVAASVLAPVAVDAAVVDSETRDERGFAPPAVAQRLTGRQWAWQPPADVTALVAAGHGVVVGLGGGTVVALDGADGDEQWRYTRSGAFVDNLVASKDGKAVVTTFRSSLDTRSQLLVVLDADTGAVRFDRVIPSVLAEVEALTPGTAVLAVRDRDVITGYDLVTGDEKWRWTPPEGCAVPYTRAVGGRTTVLTVVECPDAVRLLALDEATGAQRWQHEVPLDRDDRRRVDVHLAGTPDGALVSARITSTRAKPGAITLALFDAETGAVEYRPEPRWVVRADRGPAVLLEVQDGARATEVHVVDAATGTTRPLDAAVCPDRSADATTATTYVRKCADDGRETTVVVQPLDGSPATSVPVRMDGSGVLLKSFLVAAPGAVVVARGAFGGTPAPVVGLVGRE